MAQAAQFVGLHMKVILTEPTGYELNGYVSDIEPGISLTLMNGASIDLQGLQHANSLQSRFLAQMTGHRKW